VPRNRGLGPLIPAADPLRSARRDSVVATDVLAERAQLGREVEQIEQRSAGT